MVTSSSITPINCIIVIAASIFEMNASHCDHSYSFPLYPFSHKRITHISNKILCKIFTRFFYWSFVRSSGYCMRYNTCGVTTTILFRIWWHRPTAASLSFSLCLSVSPLAHFITIDPISVSIVIAAPCVRYVWFVFSCPIRCIQKARTKRFFSA